MSQSELIQLPFTRLEFHKATEKPLIYNMNSISYTATLKSQSVPTNLKGRLTFFETTITRVISHQIGSEVIVTFRSFNCKKEGNAKSLRSDQQEPK